MQRILFLVLMMIFMSTGKSVYSQVQNLSDLPVQLVVSTIPGDTSKPFVMYITGDGGWNDFSQKLASGFASRGYPVVALNALKYFWKKKTALQTTADVVALIRFYQQKWHRNKVILLGYSFGADVLPFVYNNFNIDMAAIVVSVNLLSPSTKTDFEIHLTGLFGGSGSGQSVAAAINNIRNKPVVIVTGEEENDLPEQQLTGKNYRMVKLAGGHHYDSNSGAVVNALLLPNR